jgi:hypothetical protein
VPVSRASIIMPVSVAPLGAATSAWSAVPESAASIITPVSVAPLGAATSAWSMVPVSAASIITPVSLAPLGAAMPASSVASAVSTRSPVSVLSESWDWAVSVGSSPRTVAISSSLTWLGSSDVMVAPSRAGRRAGGGRNRTQASANYHSGADANLR